MPATGSVFPLPLTPWERLLLTDERPGYPMVWVAQVDFAGVFDRAGFEDAMARAHERQLLMRTTVSPRREWREPPAGRADVIRWLPWADDLPVAVPESIDLRRESGFRLFIQQDDRRCRFTAQFHHAAVDGQAGIEFLLETMAAYAGLPAKPAPDPALLRTRGAAPAVANRSGTGETGPAPSLREVVGFLLRHPSPLRPEGERVRDPAPFPGMLSHTFDADEARAIRVAARRLDASVNDLFLCALFRAIAAWNAGDRPARGRRWLRVVVPTDLRAGGSSRMAANVLGFALVDRRERDCRDAAALLAGIRAETRSIRRFRLGRLFAEGLALVVRVPGLLRLVTRRPASFATVVFSNLGSLGTRNVGPLPRPTGGDSPAVPEIERILGATPLRPGTRASFVLTGVRGRLTITLRTDRRHLDQRASERLLQSLVDRLHETLTLADSSSDSPAEPSTNGV